MPELREEQLQSVQKWPKLKQLIKRWASKKDLPLKKLKDNQEVVSSIKKLRLLSSFQEPVS